jgi:pyrroline-5-carboxylate reductase
MNETRYQLGFIGGGKLAGSVIRGLVMKEFCAPGEIIVSEPSAAARAPLQNELGISVAEDNRQLAALAETIFLGVKPQMVLPIVREIESDVENKLIVSLAAGVRITNIEAVTPARVMRVMTNTPSAIGRAASALAVGTRTTSEDREKVRAILNAIGIAVEVDEDQIDAVTALSGSGPAFVYKMIEALATGAIKAGLKNQDDALQLAAQMVLGAAELLLTTGKTPEELVAMVVTPGGTTAAGLTVMQQRSTADGISAAVQAAAGRGRDMAKENR